MFQATPKLSEDKVRQCIDERLQGDYPPKAVAKVITESLIKLITELHFACGTRLLSINCELKHDM